MQHSLGWKAWIVALCLHGSAQAADLVLIHHPSTPAPTRTQVEELYAGKAKGSTLLDLPDGGPAYAEFYRKLLGKDVPQVKALWSRLVFTGRNKPPRQLHDSEAVKHAVAEEPGAIGYIERSALDASVKVAFPLP